jgi:hypothetical protein
MQRVPLDLVKPGMVLAKPILNEKGMALCGEGAELSAAMLERLKRMDVSFVTVKGHPVDLGVEEKSKEQLLAEMQGRFIHVEGDPIMELIKASIGRAIMSAQDEGVETPSHG